jgi:branched-chain amino acid transport system substrate-binding protein
MRTRYPCRSWVRVGSVLATGCVALALAACSSSSSSSSGTSPAASPAGAAASSSAAGTPVSGAPIKLGTIITGSGSYGDAVWLQMGPIWVKWTNAHGGINGHPVQLIVDDDASNPALGLSQAKQLVQQDHVVAFIGASALSTESWLGYLKQQNIPVIGGSSAALPGVGSNVFAASLSVPAETTAEYALAKLANVSKVADLYAATGAANAQYASAQTAAAKQAGASLVYIRGVTPTQPDFTAPCLGIKSSGANVAVVGISPAVTQTIMQTCLQQGYSGAFMTDAGLMSPSWDQVASLKSTPIYVLSAVWPFFLNTTPAQKEYIQAIQTYDPGMLTNPGYNAYVQVLWVGFEMFKAAAEAGGIGPSSTPADVTNALYKIHGDTLGGLTGAITYNSSDSAHPDNCYFASELLNGKWTTPFGAGAHCVAS